MGAGGLDGLYEFWMPDGLKVALHEMVISVVELIVDQEPRLRITMLHNPDRDDGLPEQIASSVMFTFYEIGSLCLQNGEEEWVSSGDQVDDIAYFMWDGARSFHSRSRFWDISFYASSVLVDALP